MVSGKAPIGILKSYHNLKLVWSPRAPGLGLQTLALGPQILLGLGLELTPGIGLSGLEPSGWDNIFNSGLQARGSS